MVAADPVPEGVGPKYLRGRGIQALSASGAGLKRGTDTHRSESQHCSSMASRTGRRSHSARNRRADPWRRSEDRREWRSLALTGSTRRADRPHRSIRRPHVRAGGCAALKEILAGQSSVTTSRLAWLSDRSAELLWRSSSECPGGLTSSQRATKMTNTRGSRKERPSS